MTRQSPRPTDLILTEGEPVPPPSPTVPEPSDETEGAALEEVKKLADRVGGAEKLRELVDRLIRLRSWFPRSVILSETPFTLGGREQNRTLSKSVGMRNFAGQTSLCEPGASATGGLNKARADPVLPKAGTSW